MTDGANDNDAILDELEALGGGYVWEPEIFAATQRFGTILENVVLLDEREVDFDSKEITENTRASYPLHFIPNFVPEGRAGHPRNIIFLTADAFGVLPPISRLTPEQPMYHFLSGYTAKVADACCIVPTVNPDNITPHSESFQATVWHLIVSHPAINAAIPATGNPVNLRDNMGAGVGNLPDQTMRARMRQYWLA